MVLERQFSLNCFEKNSKFFVISHPLPSHFVIRYESRIAIAIRGLLWMKMTMVNSGLKGLIKALIYCYANYGDQRVFFNLTPAIINILLFQCGDRLQNLTFTDIRFLCLTLSGLNLPLSSSSTTSRELLSQFSTCSGWR